MVVQDWNTKPVTTDQYQEGYDAGYAGKMVLIDDEEPEYRRGYAAGNKQMIYDIVNDQYTHPNQEKTDVA